MLAFNVRLSMRGFWMMALLLAFSSASQGQLPGGPVQSAAEFREASIRLNDLAGQITSAADARKLVDGVAQIFSDELPPAFATAAVRERIAHAEFQSATTAALIPEERIAEVWNEYVRAIGAPDAAVVTAAEVHNLRDLQYATGQLFWTRDINRSVWTMPAIVAVDPDGKVANGSRALEAIRLIYNMDRQFSNVIVARHNVQKGILFSDEVAKRKPSGTAKVDAKLVAGVDTNPVSMAERQYIREHGVLSINLLLEKLFVKLFPE